MEAGRGAEVVAATGAHAGGCALPHHPRGCRRDATVGVVLLMMAALSHWSVCPEGLAL